MKFSSLFSLVALLSSLLPVASASAATLTPGTLIKGPSEAVYYYAPNGKRLVFPNFKTYHSWYGSFDNIVTVSASELAEIPLGGNVTYRPAMRLVKITTDPRVYAVASNGTLRWVQTEDVASTLYGTDWNTKVDDIPDEFFINYTVGATIVNASDYSPTLQYNAAVDIATDKQLNGGEPAPTPPSPTPSPSPAPTPTPSSTPYLQFSVSKTAAQPGDIISFTATDMDPIGIQKIEFFFDSVLVKTCTSVSCYGDAQIPLSGTKTSYDAQVRVTKVNTQIDTSTITIPVINNSANAVHLTVGQETIMANQAGSAIVTIDPSVAVLRVDISVDNVTVKSCVSGSRQCQWSDYISGAIGSTHNVFAVVTDTLGRTYPSKILTITIGTTDSPSVVVSVAKTQIYTGETVDVTVTASDTDGVASIDILGADGMTLKHCTGAAACTVTTGPWSTAGTLSPFKGRATDAKGTTGNGESTETVSVTTH